ncbi:MAG: GNAT family N-acetyltransferase [Streptosporangiales bacterium]
MIVVDPAFVLDRWRPGDGAALRRFDLDPDTARFFGHTVEQARPCPTATTTATCAREASGHGMREESSTWRSDDARTGRPRVGSSFEPHGDHADVSYNVTAELRGQGIAPRALQAFLTWAAQQIGLRRAHLACHFDNLASRRVAEKCGFALLCQQADEYQFRRDLGPTQRPI